MSKLEMEIKVDVNQVYIGKKIYSKDECGSFTM